MALVFPIYIYSYESTMMVVETMHVPKALIVSLVPTKGHHSNTSRPPFQNQFPTLTLTASCLEASSNKHGVREGLTFTPAQIFCLSSTRSKKHFCISWGWGMVERITKYTN